MILCHKMKIPHISNIVITKDSYNFQAEGKGKCEEKVYKCRARVKVVPRLAASNHRASYRSEL